MKLTIYRKMVLGFAVVIGLMIASNGYVLFELYSISGAAQRNIRSDAQTIDHARRLQTLLDDEERNGRKYLLTGDKAYYNLFRETGKQFDRELKVMANTESGQLERSLISQIAERHLAWAQSVPPPQKRNQSASQRAASDREGRVEMEFLDRSLDRLIQLNQLSMDRSVAALAQGARRSSLIAAMLTLLTLAAASAAAWMITRTITRPIGEIIGATQRIAEGSFDPVRVSSHDETALLADAVNQMSERLKRINEHKADWTHKIVHEFRNPLQVIFSAQSMLAEKYLGDLNREQTEMLEHIRSNAEKLMDFTNQFLDLAKAQAGMMEYRMKPTDLGSLVARAVEEARMVASRKEISVALSAAPVPQVMADAEKLGQVFSNLLSNAIKYTERGGAVEVALASAQDRARISVKDFGMGIPAEDLPKLFTRFYQAGNAAGSNSKGTGLGLAVVKTFVEGHGGSVSVKSAVGAGSMFTVEIPLAGPGRAKRANPSPAA